jgi:hypothetical protein
MAGRKHKPSKKFITPRSPTFQPFVSPSPNSWRGEGEGAPGIEPELHSNMGSCTSTPKWPQCDTFIRQALVSPNGTIKITTASDCLCNNFVRVFLLASYRSISTDINLSPAVRAQHFKCPAFRRSSAHPPISSAWYSTQTFLTNVCCLLAVCCLLPTVSAPSDQ